MESFNPCCSGIWFRIASCAIKRMFFAFVSILVVVEFDLESIIGPYAMNRKVSFNPCCSGIWFRIYPNGADETHTISFQSLL